MKLFVWNSPYLVPYGGTVVYAVAANVDEARAEARAARVSHFGRPPRETEARAPEIDVSGDPRVLDLPCAEIYHWEE